VAGIGDLFGRNGVLEQLLLWGVVAQVVQSMAAPAFTALQQDVYAKAPDLVLTPEVLAEAVSRHLVSEAAAQSEAAKSGTDAERFRLLLGIARKRIDPASLAEAVLRSYMTKADAEAEALPQGIGPANFAILTDLAGDAPGAQQLAQALRRGIIEAHGRGPASTSYDQGIAEGRLHNKWGPVLEQLATVLLSPPDAASAVVRGFLSDHEGAAVAARSGVQAGTFQTMVHLAGDAPGPQQLAEALRRGLIPYGGGGADPVSFVAGIREGRLADKWTAMIRGLSQIWPTPVLALDALLKGQLSKPEALKLYEKLGGDRQFFQTEFDTRGSSPTPLELITMANRGFIPWNGRGPNVVSFEQGFLEGPWKDKWQEAYRDFAVYTPPESTVVTLLAHGAIGNREAAELLAKQGMDAKLIHAYLDEAHTEALSDYRGATVADVLNSFYAQIISAKDARTILEALHVTPSAVDLLLAYTSIRRGFAAVTNAISRVRSLFAARKITVETAKSSLHRLGVPAAAIESIMSAWEVENSISVRVLSESQIVDAWEFAIMTESEALTELENIGYTPYDAWVLLSLKAKTPIKGKPRKGPAGPQAQVIPGTT
jgi:hypothetical protein